MDFMENMEIFKDIVKFEDKYQISNYGNVRNKHTGLLLKPNYNKKGYQFVNLSISKTRHIKWYIHRLVGFHFIDNPQNKPQINHIDGNPSNNCVNNLEWVTNEENQRHAVLHNLHYQGETHKDSKFTEESVRLLPELVKIGFSIPQLSRLTGVAKINVEKVIKGKSWRALSLSFPPVRKGCRGKGNIDNFKITMSITLYMQCVKYWGNTVLNNMIAKGILSV